MSEHLIGHFDIFRFVPADVMVAVFAYAKRDSTETGLATALQTRIVRYGTIWNLLLCHRNSAKSPFLQVCTKLNYCTPSPVKINCLPCIVVFSLDSVNSSIIYY
ncbi:hypothetical protein Y032_0032g2563 [Ancylostoma ceylanicum]|uniref:Uncharacterized protein n=1 Tax=Ancylostoma ceylanicum TaxID=53326 RepID=A0A016UND8_9BILA|nr:hypothetical protein Y032_0032g2563 [Ancylostoma ceylanicum]